MSDTQTHRILSLLHKSCLVEANFCEENLLELLCGASEKRLEILQWLISQLSKDYENDLQKAESPEKDLAQKLCELKFILNTKKLSFIKGTCPAHEQKEIFGKIFKAFCFALLGKQPKQKFSLISSSYSHQPQCNKRIRLKKLSKPFDLEKAKNTLEEAKALNEQHSGLNEKVTFQEPSNLKAQQVSMSALTGTDLEKLSDSSLCLSRLMTLSHPSDKIKPASTEFGDIVENIHRILLSVTEASKEATTEETILTRKIDMKKMLEDINDFKKNSSVFKFKFQQG